MSFHRKSPPIPPILAPHFRLDEQDSLTLLTGTNPANANWLVLRFLCAALGGTGTSAGNAGRHPSIVEIPEADGFGALGGAEDSLWSHGGDLNVVLVSWLREWDFWRAECKRAVVSLVALYR